MCEEMNTTRTNPPQQASEKTISLRVKRLREAAQYASTIHHKNTTTNSQDRARRALVILTENRALVAAHLSNLIDRIVSTTPRNEQDHAMSILVRPLTITLEEAAIAIAQLQNDLKEEDPA